MLAALGGATAELARAIAAGATPPQRSAAWGWTAARLVDVLAKCPAGATEAMAAAELQLLWLAQGPSVLRDGGYTTVDALPVAAASATDARLELRVVGTRTLNGTTTTVLAVADESSERRLEMYLPPRMAWLLADEGRPRLLETPQLRVRIARARLSMPTAPGQTPTRLAPTELAVLLLDRGAAAHRAFLERDFAPSTSTLAAAWRTASGPEAEAETQHAHVRAKVLAVEAQRAGAAVVRVQDEDDAQADLVLADGLGDLATLMAEGDLLAIVAPFMRSPRELLVGSLTVLFVVSGAAVEVHARLCVPSCMTAATQETIPLSQHPAAPAAASLRATVPLNAKGALDCRQLQAPVGLVDLRPAMVNVTLMAAVRRVDVGEDEGGAAVFRVELEDGTGAATVLLPLDEPQPAAGTLAHAPRRWHAGHVVLLEQVAVSRAGVTRGQGRVVNVSILQGTAQARGLFTAMSVLPDALADRQSVLCDVTIVDVTPRAPENAGGSQARKRMRVDAGLQRVHALCLRPVQPAADETLFRCAHCRHDAVASSETALAFDADVHLSDGQTVVRAACLSGALAQLLDMLPSQFAHTDDGAQERLLASLRGRRARVLLCRASAAAWRVDSASMLVGDAAPAVTAADAELAELHALAAEMSQGE